MTNCDCQNELSYKQPTFAPIANTTTFAHFHRDELRYKKPTFTPIANTTTSKWKTPSMDGNVLTLKSKYIKGMLISKL